jgi:N-acetylglucosamine-1-phosphodiester alpha-N-acetylglucosaminidase
MRTQILHWTCKHLTLSAHAQVFASIVSARTAIGHNAAGEILLLQLDGQSNVRGKTLYEVADLLISYGAVNAINLDGGGSSTYVTNGILSSYPSDK